MIEFAIPIPPRPISTRQAGFSSPIVTAALGVILVLIQAQNVAGAETSSWVSKTIDPLPPAATRLKPSIAPRAGVKRTNQFTAKPSSKTPRGKTPAPALRGSTAPQLGDQAYFAFDQGRYLTAVKLAKQAASQNDPQAHTLLGRIYRDGYGVPKNEIAAAEWFYKGAALGDPEAAFAYGLMAARGRGVQKNLTIAAQFLDTAALSGHVLAKYNRALIYVQTSQAPADLARAFQLMSEAAQSGYSPAQYDLGGFYADGQGAAKDDKKAALWISKAAEAGLASAQLDYARLLAKGLGVAKDGRKAFEYIRRAALQNNAVAQNRLARFYAYGVQVEPDIIEATKWHLLARAAGISDGSLDQYISRNTPKERAAAELQVKAWQAKTARQ